MQVSDVYSVYCRTLLHMLGICVLLNLVFYNHSSLSNTFTFRECNGNCVSRCGCKVWLARQTCWFGSLRQILLYWLTTICPTAHQYLEHVPGSEINPRYGSPLVSFITTHCLLTDPVKADIFSFFVLNVVLFDVLAPVRIISDRSSIESR